MAVLGRSVPAPLAKGGDRPSRNLKFGYQKYDKALFLPGSLFLLSWALGLPMQSDRLPPEVRLSAKDLLWQAKPVKEESFRKDFCKREQASLVASVAVFFSRWRTGTLSW